MGECEETVHFTCLEPTGVPTYSIATCSLSRPRNRIEQIQRVPARMIGKKLEANS